MTEEERRGIINQQQRSRKRKRGKRHRRKQQVAGDSPPPSLEQTLNANTKNRSSPAAAVVKCNSKARIFSSSFLDKMKAKLSGGHFRMINEKLYTCTGQEAFNYFKEDPALFNMTPLDSSSVDVAVFCLSLMGTNYSSFILEAHRVLKPRGWLLIAEVKSRFDPSTGGADPNKFSKAICQLGFTALSKDFSNKMFILLYFKKKEDEKLNVNEIRWPGLKPCLYKRR
ncbi:ribosomal RNA-processing protein 8 isoform X2 [Coffea arabica]|uniref:Ribosomal RNA-processing protein 8 n=1 Tax=Coffea arabica TaxID=13443 RepID=A0ABM4UGF9_COFAR